MSPGETSFTVYFIYLGLVLGAFLLVTGVGQFLSRGETQGEARNRRMRMIGRGASTADILVLLRPEEGKHWYANLPFVGDLPRAMRQAGMTMSAGRFLTFCALGGVPVGTVAVVLLSPAQAAVITLVVAFLVPISVVRARRQKRVEAISQQLPDALDLLARGLRVGHPLNTSIGAVAREMPDPIGTEFGLIYDAVSYGDDLVDAVRDFADRIDTEDVRYLSGSIAIQYGTGGDLANVIGILAKVVRGRIAMRRRIKAISSEGRATAWFLSLLPIFIFVVTNMTSPDYYRGVFADPLFLPMAATVVIFVILNALILRKLVNFRI